MENGTIPNEIRIANFLGPRFLYRFASDFRRFNFVGYRNQVSDKDRKVPSDPFRGIAYSQKALTDNQ